MEAWHFRRNVLRRDLRAAVKVLTTIAEQRAARGRVASRRFRALSEAETKTIVGTDLLAQLAAACDRS